MLGQLIYFSKAAWLMRDEDLQQLLAQCRRLNTLHGITGMLLYFETDFNGVAEGRFIQVIEGPQAATEILFQNINSDRRHVNVNLLNRMSIKERDFADWSMGFTTIARDAVCHPDGFFLLSDSVLQQKKKGWNLALSYLRDFYALRSKN